MSNAVHFSKLHFGDSFAVELANCSDGIPSKFVFWVFLSVIIPLWIAAFGKHVLNVFGLCARFKVVRPYAHSIVAPVPDEFFVRYWTVMENPRSSVGSHSLTSPAMAFPDPAVLVPNRAAGGCCPYPAWSQMRAVGRDGSVLVHLRPKPFGKCDRKSLRGEVLGRYGNHGVSSARSALRGMAGRFVCTKSSTKNQFPIGLHEEALGLEAGRRIGLSGGGPIPFPTERLICR
jgi:hypothetical protein